MWWSGRSCVPGSPSSTTTVYHHPGIDTTVVVGPGEGDLEAVREPADRIMGAIARSLGRPYELPAG